MTPIAAYFVLIATETETENHLRETALDVPAPRRSLAERVVEALETLIRLGRPATVQPI